MSNCDCQCHINVVEKSVGEKLFEFLERKPENYDVSFCVGPEKKVVRALKVVLMSASPIFEKEFEEKWDAAEEKDKYVDGIPLPDFDPDAFQLFVKLTMLDTWTIETLQNLNLLPDQLLSLLAICKHFGMRNAVKKLESLTSTRTFLRSLNRYKDQDNEEFLKLSRVNLQNILSINELPMAENDVYEWARRWAEFQCQTSGVEVTGESVRDALGACLFEIRFPLMSTAEFTRVVRLKNLLTAEETCDIYQFIGLTDDEKLNHDATQSKMPFKTQRRKYRPDQQHQLQLNQQYQQKQQQQQQNMVSRQQTLPPGCSTLCLAKNVSICSSPPFSCDGKWFHENSMTTKQKILLYGLSFFGPIEKNAYYDVIVQIVKCYGLFEPVNNLTKRIERRVLARKGQVFHVILDHPVTVEPITDDVCFDYYSIRYSLRGPKTSALKRKILYTSVLEEGGVQFCFQWNSNQLAELHFKKCE